MSEREMKYWLYRCLACRRILTKYQLAAVWERAEKSGVDTKGVCVCGGGRVGPTNATIFEEVTNPHIWKLWWLDVFLPWVERTGL